MKRGERWIEKEGKKREGEGEEGEAYTKAFIKINQKMSVHALYHLILSDSQTLICKKVGYFYIN